MGTGCFTEKLNFEKLNFEKLRLGSYVWEVTLEKLRWGRMMRGGTSFGIFPDFNFRDLTSVI